jgi:hypothetical protein
MPRSGFLAPHAFEFSHALLYGREFVGCLVALGLGDDQTQVELRKLAAEYVAEAEDIERNESGGQHARQMKRPPLRRGS